MALSQRSSIFSGLQKNARATVWVSSPKVHRSKPNRPLWNTRPPQPGEGFRTHAKGQQGSGNAHLCCGSKHCYFRAMCLGSTTGHIPGTPACASWVTGCDRENSAGGGSHAGMENSWGGVERNQLRTSRFIQLKRFPSPSCWPPLTVSRIGGGGKSKI